MKDELKDEINTLKKDMVLAMTKYSISGMPQKNQEAVLNFVMVSWFETIQSNQDFITKYDFFKKLRQIIQESMLFDVVCSIEEDSSKDNISKAISIYKKMKEDSKYQEFSSKSGYRLTDDFGEEAFYLDGTLKDRVQFFHLFSNQLDEIHQRFVKKGVVRK